jgi:hypothetical protein
MTELNSEREADGPEEAAQRLGLPVAFLRMHRGYHPCVDGRHYRGSCLLTDPASESTARYFMKRHGIEGGEGR